MLAALLASAIAPAPVNAESADAVNVRWSAPTECPSEPDVRQRVAKLLAESGSGRREEVAIEMTVTATEAGYELRASAVGEGGALGERVVTGVDCGDVAEAGVLIAAIAIDPDLTPPVVPEPQPKSESESKSASESESASDSESQSESVSESESASESAPDPRPPAPPRRSPLVPVVEGGIGIGMGRLASPLPMPYARFGGGFEVRRFRLLGRLSGFGPSFGTAEDGVGGGVFGLGAIGIAPCVQSLGSPWRVVGCVATDVGLVGGAGRDVANSRTRYSVWWAIEGEVGVDYAIRPTLALALRVDGGGVPAAPRMVLTPGRQVCCVEWGAGLRFGVVGKFGAAERTR